ncbi:helix-turn-helix domain-containing protein [Pedobacter metabolipauper]|uniref:Homeodomain-like domain-containing protein n=1 Tax=Pedobacter metabolipauper TaxID=425513 RepID=A0A4R6T2F5_9SPHI|nr:helix-turn-helix domain-containing protein [Pedobacter metabolipauper]TDQ11888.1 Homeodomain-like domain-containing protein [Pedobacter metabolipauper]
METKETEFIVGPRSNPNQHFDKRLISHIVSLVEQGVPRKDLIREYGMSSRTLEEWLSKHGYRSGIKSYTQAERRSVVRAVESGMSIKEALIVFNISSRTVINHWIKRFKEENAELNSINPPVMPKKETSESNNTELRALQKALDEANLKIRALDTMIDIAEEQLKIDIRKKSGARQSSK